MSSPSPTPNPSSPMEEVKKEKRERKVRKKYTYRSTATQKSRAIQSSLLAGFKIINKCYDWIDQFDPDCIDTQDLTEREFDRLRSTVYALTEQYDHLRNHITTQLSKIDQSSSKLIKFNKEPDAFFGLKKSTSPPPMEVDEPSTVVTDHYHEPTPPPSPPQAEPEDDLYKPFSPSTPLPSPMEDKPILKKVSIRERKSPSVSPSERLFASKRSDVKNTDMPSQPKKLEPSKPERHFIPVPRQSTISSTHQSQLTPKPKNFTYLHPAASLDKYF